MTFTGYNGQDFLAQLNYEKIISRRPDLEGLNHIQAKLLALVEPSFYYLTKEITKNKDTLTFLSEPPLKIKSSYLLTGLKNCQTATLLAASLGPKLAAYSSQCFNQGQLWEGIMTDLFGSELIELLTIDFFLEKAKYFSSFGLYPSLRFSPGYGDWSLEDQKQIIELLQARPEIQVTSNFILEPVKSITVLVGWSNEPTPNDYPLGDKTKALCAAKDACSNCQTWACKK